MKSKLGLLLIAAACFVGSASQIRADVCSAGVGATVTVPEGTEALAGVTVQCSGFTFGNGLAGAQGGAVFLDPTIPNLVSDVVVLANVNIGGIMTGVATFVSDIPLCVVGICTEPGLLGLNIAGLPVVLEPNAFVTEALSVNGGGTGVKFTFSSDGEGGGVPSDVITVGPTSAVPEPGTLGMFATGLLSLAGVARRKWYAKTV